MSRKRHAIHVDTFPFLAVLLCAMGSLILLLLIFDRRAKVVARAKAQENAAQAAAKKAKTVHSDDEDWKRKIHQLHELLVQQQLELQNQLRAILGNKAATAQRLKDEEKEIRSLHKAIGEQKADLDKKRTELAIRRGVLAKASEQEKAAQKDLERFARELDQLERTLYDLQAVKRRDKETYSLVPYHGKRGANRKPIYVECTAYSLVFHPGGKSLSPLSMTPAEFLAEAVRLGGKLPEKSDGDKEPDSPYVLFLVRPNGIASYYQAQAAMKELNMDFGYEFVEADWVFDFGGEGNIASQAWQSAPSGMKAGLSSNGSGPVALGIGPGLAGSGSGPSFGPVSASGGLIPGVPISATGSGPGGNNIGAGSGSGIGLWPGNGTGNGVGGGSGFGSGGSGIAGSGNGSGSPGRGGSGSSPGGSGNGGSGNGNGWPGPGGSGIAGSGNGNGYPGGTGSGAGGSGIAGSGNGSGYPRGGGSGSGAGGSGNAGSGNGNGYQGSSGSSSGPGGTGNAGAANGSGSLIARGSGIPATGSNYGQNGGDSAGTGQGQTMNPGPWQPSSGQPGNATNSGNQGVQGGSGPPVQIGVSSKPGQDPGQQPDESDLDRQRRLYQPGGGGSSGGGTGMAIPLGQATPFANLQKPEKSTKPNIPLGRLIGNRDFVLVLECTADAVIIQPWGTRFPLPSLPKQADPSHPLVAAIQQLINRRQATVLPGETPYRPILRFKVRPDGLRAYYLAYPLLEGLRLPMLRENVDSP